MTCPNAKTFRERIGNKAQMVEAVLEFCESREELSDVFHLCSEITVTPSDDRVRRNDNTTVGYVYLIRSGRYHKIGRSNSVGRRSYELATKLPAELTTVHSIQTDDPVGVEAYWHKRFADKRRNGEWFLLDVDDVRAFKRWVRIH